MLIYITNLWKVNTMIPVAHTTARSTLTMKLIWPWQQQSLSVENSTSAKKIHRKRLLLLNEEKCYYEQVAYPGQKLGVRRSQCVHWFVPGTHWLGPLAVKGKETNKVTSLFHFFFCLRIRCEILIIYNCTLVNKGCCKACSNSSMQLKNIL